MIRMQIQLTEEQRDAVRHLAHEQRRSEASVVRDAVDAYLRDVPGRRRQRMLEALEHAGTHRSGCADVSVRHDEYLADAISGD